MAWCSEYCYQPRLSRRHRARYVSVDPQNGKTRTKMKTQALAQIPETKHAGGPVVRLSDVVKVYKEGDVEVSAIKGITFDIPRQRFSMIVGPSGSGKTVVRNRRRNWYPLADLSGVGSQNQAEGRIPSIPNRQRVTIRVQISVIESSRILQ